MLTNPPQLVLNACNVGDQKSNLFKWTFALRGGGGENHCQMVWGSYSVNKNHYLIFIIFHHYLPLYPTEYHLIIKIAIVKISIPIVKTAKSYLAEFHYNITFSNQGLPLER